MAWGATWRKTSGPGLDRIGIELPDTWGKSMEKREGPPKVPFKPKSSKWGLLEGRRSSVMSLNEG